MASPATVAPLAGGEIFVGMTLVITLQTLYEHGVKFNLNHDKKRQTVLNSMILLTTVAGAIVYPFNATMQSIPVSNATT
jgi:hypothetical protein